ncbi:MAG: membrane protein insertase YidC, partial [Gammaproteobacteria bacterium]
MENVRLMLVVALAFLGLMLWEAWQTDYGPQPQAVADNAAAPGAAPAAADAPPAPASRADALPSVLPDAPADSATAPQAHTISVRTDLFDVTLSTAGATMERAALRAYPLDPATPEVPVELLGVAPPKIYIYQGGLAGDPALPT